MYRPQPDEFPPFYAGYIQAVNDDVITELEQQAIEIPDFIKAIPLEKGEFAYADGKWIVKELLGHVIDTERIMIYRATCFARNDKNLLPGFEENDYVDNAHFSNRSLESFADEFSLLRRANLYFIKSLSNDELKRFGTANGGLISVKALLFVIAGHVKHHKKILIERYL